MVRELSCIYSDGPELSCQYIDGVIRRFPDAKTTMEYIRGINAQLRYDRDGYQDIYQSLKSEYDALVVENAKLKDENEQVWNKWRNLSMLVLRMIRKKDINGVQRLAQEGKHLIYSNVLRDDEALRGADEK